MNVEKEESCTEFRKELRETGWKGRVSRRLRKHSWSADRNCHEGVWCILWMEERGEGDPAVEWRSAGKYLNDEVSKEKVG